MSIPTAFSTAAFSADWPSPSGPSLPGMRIIAGLGTSLYRAISCSRYWARFLDVDDGVFLVRLPREVTEDLLGLLGSGGGEHVQAEGLEAHDRVAAAQNGYFKH